MVYIVSLAAVVALLPVIWFIVIALFAWRVPGPAPHGSRSRRVVALVPAHNEASVIQHVLSDLKAQDYPSGSLEVHVVADRCTDDTADIARQFAVVHERTTGEATKGAAVAWLVERLEIRGDDVVAVFDADSRLGDDVVGALCDGADEGFRVMQAYLGITNPDASYVSLAGALSQWLSNRLIDLPRRNLGMSSSLLGTGYAVVGELAPMLVDAGRGLTEDQALSDRLVVDGERVVWLHRTPVLDEKPASMGVLTRQRSRWAHGKTHRRRHALRPLAASGGDWSMSRVDRIVQLVLPGRTVSAVVAAVIAVVATIWPSTLAFSPIAIYVSLAIVALMSVAALVVEGAGLVRIIKIPLIGLFALLWIPERIMGRRGNSWYHTPHEGSGSG